MWHHRSETIHLSSQSTALSSYALRPAVRPAPSLSADFLCQTATLPFLVKGDGAPGPREFTSHAVNFGPGQGVHVPPYLEHSFCNRSTENVALLVISSHTTAGRW